MNKTKVISFAIALSISGISCSLFAQSSSAGWKNLFNGKDLTGWKRLAGTADYKVEDGAIVGTTIMNSGNTFLVTEKEYGDFILELDAKVESPVSNSGVQTRSHFDAAANNGKGKVYGRQCEFDPSARQWAGGIYDEGRRDWLYPLELNPSAKGAFKVGEYNHIKIECIGNEMKTWVNGTPAAYVVDTIDKKGFIGLQVHAISNEEQANKKVYFKNIRIKTSNLNPEAFPAGIYVVNNVPNSLSGYEKQDNWKLLFDGKTSSGWRSAKNNSFPREGWQIKNGILTVQDAEGKESANGGDIVTNDQYKAFDLSFEFKLTPGANSGVKYFVTLDEKTSGSAIGLEYQVLDDERHPDAKLGRDGNRTLASLYDLIKADKQARFTRPIGQWNKGRVVVYPNNHVEHFLNGIKVLEYERGSKSFKDLVAMSKYKVWPNFGEAEKGHILLQDHGNEVSFRSIKIKTLNQ
ncbi:3-keto-disaccharide hydrolase [Rubrolithibacter danxiaensis]|uniref:3-keto-disaccharide hydrolase n=1 Tax=Rubrolithibacter danxiaensis TaxID=3390805 RepID=UPI003BF7F5E0